ncbi:carbohydrate ABC transporter permease [Curtobacterium sp. 'Ferrero']|uniref:carbohydrate ABC transporter permease n=1 Tax=Curtobacterium sp. 'Ferrero' TaxID=2033654 RepID=UPI0026CB96AD
MAITAARPDTTTTRAVTAPGALHMTSPRGRTMRWVSNVVLLAIAVCFAVPLLWLVLASLDTQASLSVKVPSQFTLDNFAKVLTPDLSFIPLANSLLLSGGTAVVTVVVAILAAYPLSRYRMRINKPFLYSILFGTGLPITAMMVPVYALFVSLNLIDNVWGCIFFLAATSLPMAIWMSKNFMDSVPIVLEEAAWTDGASMLTTLWRVVIPLMRPGIAVVFIFVFIQAWGNFFVPFVLLLSPDKQPAAVSIFNFFGQNGAVAYGQLAAFSIVYSVPVIALYVIVSRGLGGGSALAGGIKG